MNQNRRPFRCAQLNAGLAFCASLAVLGQQHELHARVAARGHPLMLARYFGSSRLAAAALSHSSRSSARSWDFATFSSVARGSWLTITSSSRPLEVRWSLCRHAVATRSTSPTSSSDHGQQHRPIHVEWRSALGRGPGQRRRAAGWRVSNHGRADQIPAQGGGGCLRLATPTSIRLEAIELLSPVTTPCRVYCQGANYRRHMIESGLDPDAKAFNMFFTKADASISPPNGTVQPQDRRSCSRLARSNSAWCSGALIESADHVHAGNAEGLRLTRRPSPTASARATFNCRGLQVFQGKSYRGFCPIGHGPA